MIQTPTSWGHHSRHYAEGGVNGMAAEAAGPSSAPSPMERRWTELLEKASPGVRDVVERKALLEKQSGPYRAHLEWVSGEERGGESVRVAMIECRSQRMTESAKFGQAIDRRRR